MKRVGFFHCIPCIQVLKTLDLASGLSQFSPESPAFGVPPKGYLLKRRHSFIVENFTEGTHTSLHTCSTSAPFLSSWNKTDTPIKIIYWRPIRLPTEGKLSHIRSFLSLCTSKRNFKIKLFLSNLTSYCLCQYGCFCELEKKLIFL